MNPATKKPPKITAQLLQDYHDAVEQQKEIARTAKPYADKAKSLAAEIQAALQAAGVTTKKAGDFRCNLIEKPGLVPWKEVCVSRLDAEQLAAIESEYSSATRISIEVVAA